MLFVNPMVTTNQKSFNRPLSPWDRKNTNKCGFPHHFSDCRDPLSSVYLCREREFLLEILLLLYTNTKCPALAFGILSQAQRARVLMLLSNLY